MVPLFFSQPMMDSATLPGAAYVPGAPAGPQAGAPYVPGAPAGPQAGGPYVPGAPAGPQAGGPYMPGTPAGSATATASHAAGATQTAVAGHFLGVGAAKIIITVVLIVAVVGGAAGGAYALTRPGAPLAHLFGPPPPPPPAITAQSAYHVGTTPAGSTSTMLQVSGQQFAANSAITFLLDGKALTDAQPTRSDGQGNFKATLTITAAWTLGTHTLSAKDAQGHTASSGIRVMIVAQGEAHTPGPNGAPPDDTSFKLTWSPDGASGQYALIITSQPDPHGGKPCGPMDDGQVYTTLNVVDSVDGARQATTCSGTYKGGQLSYTQTILSWQNTYSGSNITCQESGVPQMDFELTGTFTSATTISGTINVDAYSLTCDDGTTPSYQSATDTWTGTISSTP